MILYTSYHLASKHGASLECPGFAAVADAIGGQPTEGIPLKKVWQYAGLQDALWCLRAVHPEQKSVARKAARIWIVEAARSVIHYQDSKFLMDAIRLASDILDGLADRHNVIDIRTRVWEHIPHLVQPYKWAGYLAWMALGGRPELRASDAWEAWLRSLRFFVPVNKLEAYYEDMATVFLKAVHRADGACAGPGVYDHETNLSDYSQKKMEPITGPIVRRKYTRRDRQISALPRKGKHGT